MTKKVADTKLNKRQTEAHRASIKVGALISRLSRNALGTLTTPQGEPIEMTAGQIKSATALIDKALANLQATEITHIEEHQDRATLESQVRELTQSLSAHDLKTLIAAMPEDERRLLFADTGTEH